MHNEASLTTANTTQETETPYSNWVSLFLWFIAPAFVLGLCLYSILETDFFLTRTNSGEFTSVLFLVSFAVPLFLVSSEKHRSTSVFFCLFLATTLASLTAYHNFRFLGGFSAEKHSVNFSNWPQQLSWISSFAIATVAMPFYRTVFQRKNKFYYYPTLFEFAWNHFVLVLIGCFFVGFVFALFGIAYALFEVIELKLEFLWEPIVSIPTSFVAFAIGVAICRYYEKLVHSLAKIMLGLMKALLPLHLTISVFFLVFFLKQEFAGLAGETGYFASTNQGQPAILLFLISAYLGLNFCTSAVGITPEKKHRLLEVLWRGMALTTFALCLVAAHFAWKIYLHAGLSTSLLLNAMLILVVLFHATGYVIAALSAAKATQKVQQTNVAGAMLLAAIFVLLQTPALDLAAMTANDQKERILAGDETPDQKMLNTLDKNLGYVGQRALDEIYATNEFNLPERNAISTRVVHRKMSVGERWDNALLDGTLKVHTPVKEDQLIDQDGLRQKLTRSSDFNYRCFTRKNICRIIINAGLKPDAHHAMIITRTNSYSMKTVWLEKTSTEPWRFMHGYNERDPHAVQYDISNDDFDTLIRRIDSGEFVVKTRTINTLEVGDAMFSPSVNLRLLPPGH